MATFYQIVLSLTVLIFLGTLHSANCIHCWDCNSAYDPRCGDPFDNHSIAMVDCSQMSYPHLSVKEATLCRKSTQLVNGNVRVVRSCGWLNSSNEDDGKSCFKRSGSQDVFLTHCTCFTDGCNGSPGFLVPTFVLTIPVLLTFLLFSASVNPFC